MGVFNFLKILSSFFLLLDRNQLILYIDLITINLLRICRFFMIFQIHRKSYFFISDFYVFFVCLFVFPSPHSSWLGPSVHIGQGCCRLANSVIQIFHSLFQKESFQHFIIKSDVCYKLVDLLYQANEFSSIPTLLSDFCLFE